MAELVYRTLRETNGEIRFAMFATAASSSGQNCGKTKARFRRAHRATGAANLKFLSVLRPVRHRNFKFKAATQINKLLELL
jgi:hypothetical protein